MPAPSSLTPGFETLRQRIESREAVVAVVGLGYVGLPLLHAVAIRNESTGREGGFGGYPAVGLDHDAAKVTTLRAGGTYLPHLGEKLTQDLAAAKHVRFSSDPADLREADVIIICVPTPIDEHHEPDLAAVERAASEIRDRAITPDPTRPRLIILESTTYPGTTRDILAPILIPSLPTAHSPLPTALFLAFSPEREDPGNPAFSTRTIPKLVGGVTPEAGTLARLFYERVVRTVVPVSSAEVAEAAKVVENVYRAVNIALVNELKIALSAMGLDIWEVLDAAATKPFGFHRFNPGPGFGGHCVPVDPFYLAWKARQVGAKADFIELAGLVNRRMPEFVVSRCIEALSDDSKDAKGAKVLVLGLAYKPDIADVRESPSFELIELLRDAGAEVSYHDPHVPRTWRGRRHDLQMESVSWAAETLQRADLVLISTDHAWYDWGFVARHARLVVDTRNAMARAGQGNTPGTARVVKA
jgi:UDP-N-acetyl-D-glucosamine dehydrogenase